MEARKKIKIFTGLFITLAILIIVGFCVGFGLSAKNRQQINSELTAITAGVPNYSYAVGDGTSDDVNISSGSFDIYLTDNSGNVVKPESINSVKCDKTFISNKGEEKPVVVKTRVDSSCIYYRVDSEYVVNDTVNKFDNVKLTISVTYQGKDYNVEVDLRVTATPNYNLTFYYNTVVGDYTKGAKSELPIGAGYQINRAVSDANKNGADIDLDTEEVAQELLENYDFDGWYILDSKGKATQRRLYPDDYFDISNLYVQENEGINNVAVVAKYKTKLLLDDDMGEQNYLAVNNGVASFVSDENNATDIYFNEKLPISKLPGKEKKRGWEFVDWYSEPAGEKIDYLDEDGRFSMIKPHLYAKWKGDIKLDSVFETVDFASEDIIVDKSDTTKTTLLIPNVIYHSDLALPSGVDIKYSHGGRFVGWHIRDGEKDIVVSGREFKLSADTRIYAKVDFDVELDNQGTTVNNKTAIVEYGYSGNSLGQIIEKLPYPQSIVENGWRFEEWNTASDGTGTKIETFWAINPYELKNPNKSDLVLYAKRSTIIYLYRQLDVNGQNTITPEAKTIYYNRILTEDIIPSSLPDTNGWHYGGYYKVANKDIGAKVITLTDSELRSTDKYTGVGELEIGAKWSAELSLDPVFDEKIKETVVYNQVPDLPTVTYPADNNGNRGAFIGWHTIHNGAEQKLSGESYQYSANQTIYARVKFPIMLQGQLINVRDPYNIIYGSSEEKRSGIGTLENRLPTSGKVDGWSFIGWNTKANGSGIPIVNTFEINPYEHELVLYGEWQTDFRIDRMLDERGQATNKYWFVSVKYNAQPEDIPDELQANGWTYTGCYKDLEDVSSKIEKFTPYKSLGDNSEMFVQLYVRWTTNSITLRKTNIKTGELHNYNLEEVAYNTKPDLSVVDEYYYTGASCVGWYSQDGQQISATVNYTGGADTIFNDKVEIPIKTDGTINSSFSGTINNVAESYSIYYGESLNDFNARKTLKEPTISDDSWEFKYWYFTIGGQEMNVLDETTKAVPFNYKVINQIQTASEDGSEYLLLKAKWQCEVSVENNYISNSDTLGKKSFVADNNKECQIISTLAWGSWRLKGVYADKNYTNPIDDYTHYLGTGKTTLYAKWECTPTLICRNNQEIEPITFIYGNKSQKLDNLSINNRIGYYGFLRWSIDINDSYKKNSDTNYLQQNAVFADATTVYPKDMSTLYGVWDPKRYTVTVKVERNLTTNNESLDVRTGEKLGQATPSEKLLYNFTGYWYGGNRYINEMGEGSKEWDIDADITLEAQYGDVPSKVSLVNGITDDKYGEIDATASNPLQPEVGVPYMTGYDFVGYYSTKSGMGDCYYDEKGQRQNNSNWGDTGIGTLYSRWNAHKHAVESYPKNATIIIKAGGQQLSDQELSEVPYGTTLNILISYSKTNNQKCYYNYTGDSQLREQNNQKYSLVMPDKNIEIHASSEDPPPPPPDDPSCVAAGTKILLADRTTKAVENIVVGDIVKAWDHKTGEFIDTPVFYTFMEYGYVDSIVLKFSNEVTIELLNSGQGLYDIDLKQYVLVNADSVHNYVGHHFLYADNSRKDLVPQEIELVNYVISQKLTPYYDIATEVTMTSIANGLINCSDTIVGLCNMFDFNSDYTYDAERLEQDIALYGLYEYEEWSDYISRDDFNAFNGALFKIAVGKGLLTEEEIIGLISDLFESRNI